MNRIKELRKKHGYSQQELANLLFVNQTAVSQWERGSTTPSPSILLALSDLFETTTDYLLGRTDDPADYEDGDLIASISQRYLDASNGNVKKALAMQKENEEDAKKEASLVRQSRKIGIKIPVLGYVRAGMPMEAVEEIIDYEEISEEMARQGEYFGLQIKGDSMEPRIKEGDVVIVRKQSDVISGDIAVVMVNGEDATVKKIVKHENGISLLPFNQAYAPLFYTQDEAVSLPVEIIGRVVELRGKF